MNLQRRSPMHHIMISGTGRSGTTALMQLFTYLGVDTGYDRETCWGVDPISSAGLEFDVTRPDRPYLIKSPWLSRRMEEARETGIAWDCAILPIRSLADAAQSRRRVYHAQAASGNDRPHDAAGSLWATRDPESQEAASAMEFHHLLHALQEQEVPTFLPVFPRLATDADYLWRTLETVFRGLGVSRASFKIAHARVMQPEKIHTFTKEQT